MSVTGELTRAITDAVDARADEIVALTRELVRTRSVNPRYPGADFDAELGGELDCVELLEPRLADAGFATEVVARVPRRGNLVARRAGSGGGTSLALNGHVDTVAPGDPALWNDSPWSGAQRDGRVHGLGSADMKGPIAAFVVAARVLTTLDVELRGDLVLQCVCAEETGEAEVGTEACLDSGRADVAICAEPSGTEGEPSIALAPVGVGTLLLRITVTGASVHAARRREAIYPVAARSGASAADKGLELAAALSRLERSWGMHKRARYFPPGQFVLNLGAIDCRAVGAGSAFFLADRFVADYAIYYPPHERPEQVRAEIEACVRDAALLDDWLREHPPQLEWTLDMPPVSAGDGGAVHQALAGAIAEVTGAPPILHGFAAGCDASWLERAGIPTVIYGPGDLGLAHRPNESVSVDWLVEAAKVYALAAVAVCNTPAETP